MTDREDLLAFLAVHTPLDEAERRSVEQMTRLVATLEAPFDEHADPRHVTASSIVLGADGRVVLHRHKRLGIWLQPGGHIDHGEKPADAGIREATEETGLDVSHADGSPRIVHVDVHDGGRGHLHLDLRYLLVTDDDTFAPAPGESPELRWATLEEVAALGDASVVSAVSAALTRNDAASG